MLNYTIKMGRLTANPELKHTASGLAVTTFIIAVNDRQDKTYFFDCVAWRNTAEFVCKYFTKGKSIIVEGKDTTRTYEDKQGNKRKVCEIVVNQVNFTGEKKDESTQTTSEDFEEIVSDDLPF